MDRVRRNQGQTVTGRSAWRSPLPSMATSSDLRKIASLTSKSCAMGASSRTGPTARGAALAGSSWIALKVPSPNATITKEDGHTSEGHACTITLKLHLRRANQNIHQDTRHPAQRVGHVLRLPNS